MDKKDELYYLKRIDEKFNILLNMFDDFVRLRYGFKFDIKRGCFVLWEKK